MKKQKTTTTTTSNFIITSVPRTDDVVISTKSYDWKLTLSGVSNPGQQVKYYLENNTNDEVDQLLTIIYYSSVSVMQDAELAGMILDYFEKKINPDVEEAGDDEEEIELTKEFMKGGEG